MRRRAFTLIEMLVVITIIALLAALVLGALGALRSGAKRSRTQTVLQTVAQGLSIRGAEMGGRVAPVEHPFAGSTAPRFALVRGETPHDAVDQAGVALLGALPANVPSAPGRVLLPGDRFADLSAAMLYGATREQLGILGLALPEVTTYRLLPMVAAASAIPDPDAVGRMMVPADPITRARTLLTTVLGGNAADEVAKLGAFYEPPDDTQLIVAGRVWSATAAGVQVPGTFRVAVAGAPHSYRLRGIGIYDAWGNEVFYALRQGGASVQLVSAGRDGALAIHPGSDGAFQSAPAGPLAGDDRDGSVDNVVVGGGAER